MSSIISIVSDYFFLKDKALPALSIVHHYISQQSLTEYLTVCQRFGCDAQ